MLSGLKLADSMARSDAGSLACHPVAGFSFPGRSLADLSLACRWLVAGLSLACRRLVACVLAALLLSPRLGAPWQRRITTPTCSLLAARVLCQTANVYASSTAFAARSLSCLRRQPFCSAAYLSRPSKITSITSLFVGWSFPVPLLPSSSRLASCSHPEPPSHVGKPSQGTVEWKDWYHQQFSQSQV